MSRTHSFDFAATNLDAERPTAFTLLPQNPQGISWPDKSQSEYAGMDLEEIESLLSTDDPIILTSDHGALPWDQSETLPEIRVSVEDVTPEQPQQVRSDSSEEAGISWGRVGLVAAIAAIVCLAVWTRIEMDQTVAVLSRSIEELHQRPISTNAAVVVADPVDETVERIFEEVAESSIVEDAPAFVNIPYSFKGGETPLSLTDFDYEGFQVNESASPLNTKLMVPANQLGVMPNVPLRSVKLAATQAPITLDEIAKRTTNLVSREGEISASIAANRTSISLELQTPLAVVAIPVVAKSVELAVSLTHEPQQRIGTALQWTDSLFQASETAERESKLVFVLHVANDFQSSGNTSREMTAFTAGALSDATVGKYFGNNFSCTFERIGHWSVEKETVDKDLVADLVGYFCTADGEVIQAIVGSISAEQLLQEAKWAVELFRGMKDQDQETQKQQVATAHNKRLPQKSGWSSLLNQPAEQEGNKQMHKVHRILADQPLSSLPSAYRVISEEILGRPVADDSVSNLALQMGH